MSQNFSYPSSSTVSISAIGTNNAAAPTTSIQVAGEDIGGILRPLSTDTSGHLNVNATISGGIANPLPVQDSAAEASLAALNTKTAGALVPVAFNEVDLTYVPSGNGVGQVATAVYKLASSTVKTLTMSYDSSNRLSSVVAS